MTVELDQALFGYDRGHRLIASSRKLGKEATWVLRNVTDMKVPKRGAHYLTVLPVPDIDTHAFVRTWAASGAFRPGSVWSHSLLVPTADLDKIEDLRVLVQLFTKPTIEDPASLAELKKTYGKQINLPAHASANIAAPPVEPALLDRIILAVYRTEATEPAEVVVDDAREVEQVILGLMSQRWSHLRRRFAARTRFRPSQTSAVRFELEVVERGSGASERAPNLPVPEWAVALRSDLQRPNPHLRLFVRTHTQESDDRPDVVAKITDVVSSATRSPSAAVEAIARWFPHPSDKLDLKRDLFGPARSATPISDTWPTADPEQLQLLLSAPSAAVALTDYQVGTRLADWARIEPVDAAVAIVGSDISNRSETDIDELVAGIAGGFDTMWVGKLIGTLPRIAPTLLARRPDVWSNPEVWTTEVDHDLIVDLITQAEPSLRRATYIELLSNGLAGAASELLQPDPSLWWSIVDPDHADHVAHDQLAMAGSRRLAMAVTSTRGPCPWQVATLSQAIVIASVTDPDEGIWRNVDADLWVETYTADLDFPSEDSFGPVRRDVMALGAALASDQPAQRRLLWSLVFRRLHTALLGTGTPLGCERTLATLLPHGPSWDWCGRLRHALARTAVTDGWSDVELRDIAQGAGEFAPDVLALADSLRHHQERSILDEVVDFLTWWR
jgi:hypothetical protein